MSMSDFVNSSCFPKEVSDTNSNIKMDKKNEVDDITINNQNDKHEYNPFDEMQIQDETKSEEKKSFQNKLSEKIMVDNALLEKKYSDKGNPELFITTEIKAPLAMPEDVHSSEIHVDNNRKNDPNKNKDKNRNSFDNLVGEDVEYNRKGSAKSLEKEYIQEKVEASEFGIRWSMLTDVIDSGIKPIINKQEKILQEAMFEIMSSEAKYYSGLRIVMDQYYNSYLFSPVNDKCGYVNPIDKHRIFSNLSEIMETSKKLLQDFEKRWQDEKPYLHDVCDILYEHSIGPDFKQFVIYIRNQSSQQETYQRLMESAIIKKEMQRLQESGCGRGLPLDSYFLLPMQRLTRYKLLAENVKKVLDHPDIAKETYQTQIENANKAIEQISKLLSISNQGKIEMDNQALLMDLLNKIDFPSISKCIPLEGKVLLKEGEYDIDQCYQKHGPKLMKRSSFFVLLLFNDLMIIGKRNSSRIVVLDYCARKDVIFTVHVSRMIKERRNKKNVYYVSDLETEDNPRFFLQFSRSYTNYLRDPIILKVKSSDELNSWLKYLPDYNNKDVFDYSRPSNFNYWSTVKKLNVFVDL